MESKDNRKFLRREFREAVGYRYPETLVLNGSVGCDLSEGGIRFRTEEFLPQDAQVVVNIQLKADREATLEARIIWVQKVPHAETYHIGCEFLESRDNVFPRFIVKNFLELNKS
jgi:hypothetical protein